MAFSFDPVSYVRKAKPPAAALSDALGATQPKKQSTMTPEQVQTTLAMVDPASPTYKGPGYEIHYDANGDPTVGKKLSNGSVDPIAAGDQRKWEEAGGNTANAQPKGYYNDEGEFVAYNYERDAPASAGVMPTNYVDMALDRLSNPVTNPALEKKPTEQRAAFGDTGFAALPGRAPKQTADKPLGTTPMAEIDPTAVSPDKLREAFGTGAGGPGSEAPDIDRTKIDTILSGLSGYENKMADLAADNTGLSVAEAQLKKATDLANLQAGIDTEASQRAAMGAARSARSRGDRALLERQAVGESAFIGQEAARTAALRRAEQEGNLAELRAQEEDYDRRFRLEALGKAADLGLNRSALEVDISKTNLDSATNWINQQFNQLGIDKQLNQEEAQMLLGFSRDMAAIQFQYDQLSSQEQQEADKLLMQKYGIDQGTLVAMKQIKEQGKFRWDQVLAGIAGGAGTGLVGAGAKALGIG